jgi:hypothetical protein
VIQFYNQDDYNSGQKCINPSNGTCTFGGLLAEPAVALSDSADEQVEEASAGAALEQRKKLLLPSSISFSSGSNPVCK